MVLHLGLYFMYQRGFRVLFRSRVNLSICFRFHEKRLSQRGFLLLRLHCLNGFLLSHLLFRFFISFLRYSLFDFRFWNLWRFLLFLRTKLLRFPHISLFHNPSPFFLLLLLPKLRFLDDLNRGHRIFLLLTALILHFLYALPPGRNALLVTLVVAIGIDREHLGRVNARIPLVLIRISVFEPSVNQSQPSRRRRVHLTHL
jgi:hypothetical protein